MNTDKQTSEVIADVLVRFREHDQYGSREKAIKAFAKRCPALSARECQAIFDFHSNLLEATIDATRKPMTTRGYLWVKQTAYYWDAMLADLKCKFPTEEEDVLTTYLNWVIFWHILK